MRKIIGQLGSIGVGVIMTAAGLAFDAQTLTYAGIAIFALMLALALWSWGHTAQPVRAVAAAKPGSPLALDESLPPAGLDTKDRALFILKQARDNAIIARRIRSSEVHRRAYEAFLAALLSAKREFGTSTLKFRAPRGAVIPYRDALEAYVAYADKIYPLLREGHFEEAKRVPFDWEVLIDD